MSGYMLVWILLQKIEKLEEELKKYQDKTKKLNNISSGQSLPALFLFLSKKKICDRYPHILCT